MILGGQSAWTPILRFSLKLLRSTPLQCVMHERTPRVIVYHLLSGILTLLHEADALAAAPKIMQLQALTNDYDYGYDLPRAPGIQNAAVFYPDDGLPVGPSRLRSVADDVMEPNTYSELEDEIVFSKLLEDDPEPSVIRIPRKKNAA
ncbi:unnamed protein product [Cyprideis torosa]|uniref:Uncharacterized protein n=1 Tax=Cyprideis torosa TaxID=163714 RepID=A0A7R8WWV0_9CRUS|nr:unnamed protein product [Cyprideis torosa]CAG0907447.1 unnamed protein product [Cyprideis torosa]